MTKSEIPPERFILPVRANPNTTTVATIITIASIITCEPVVSGLTVPAIPNTNRILNMLEPITFPKANSFWPFLAATTLVTNSGKEVPTATIVNPTKDSAKSWFKWAASETCKANPLDQRQQLHRRI